MLSNKDEWKNKNEAFDNFAPTENSLVGSMDQNFWRNFARKETKKRQHKKKVRGKEKKSLDQKKVKLRKRNHVLVWSWRVVQLNLFVQDHFFWLCDVNNNLHELRLWGKYHHRYQEQCQWFSRTIKGKYNLDGNGHTFDVEVLT